MLEKDFSKVTYSKNEKGSFTELFIINDYCMTQMKNKERKKL